MEDRKLIKKLLEAEKMTTMEFNTDLDSINFCPTCGKDLVWEDFGIEDYKTCKEHGSVVESNVDDREECNFHTIKIYRPKKMT